MSDSLCVKTENVKFQAQPLKAVPEYTVMLNLENSHQLIILKQDVQRETGSPLNSTDLQRPSSSDLQNIHLKGSFSQTWKICQLLMTLSFLTRMTYFLLWSTKADV